MKWKEIKKSAGDFLPNLFRLRSNQDHLLTNSVRGLMTIFGIMLAIQFMIDTWAWNRAVSFIMPEQPWWGGPLIAGLGLATLIAYFDSVIITSDISKTRFPILSMTGRFFVLFLIAALTAVPVELAVFEAEINKNFDQKEKVALDSLRTNAIATEQQKYDKVGGLLEEAQTKGDALIEEAKIKYDGNGTPTSPGLINQGNTRVGTSANQARTDAQVLLDRYTTQRAAERKTKIDPLQAEVDRLTAEVASQQGRFDQEITGRGGTGRRGVGRIADMQAGILADLRNKLSAAQAALTTAQNDQAMVQFDAETTNEVARLQAAVASAGNTAQTGEQTKVDALIAERDQKLTDLRKERDDKIDALRKERDDKIDALRVADGDLLATKYGGQWKESRGFLDRFRELRAIAARDAASNAIIWGCRILMMLVGLVIMIVKLFAKGDFADYFNRDLQLATSPDEKMIEMARAKGYTDDETRKALGYSHETRDQLEKLLNARKELKAVFDKWKALLLTISTPDLKNGSRCKTREEITRELETAWRKDVTPKLTELTQQEEDLKLIGIPVPAWPATLGDNPTVTPEPWMVTPAQLSVYGWSDPVALIDTLNGAKGQLRQARQAIEIIVLNALQTPLAQAIGRSPGKTRFKLRLEFEANRTEVYCRQLAPLISTVETLEEFLRQNAEPIPDWKPAFLHPPTDLRKVWLIPTVNALRADYGWKGQEEDTSLPFKMPDPVVLPPPATPHVIDTDPSTQPPAADTNNPPANADPLSGHINGNNGPHAPGKTPSIDSEKGTDPAVAAIVDGDPAAGEFFKQDDESDGTQQGPARTSTQDILSEVEAENARDIATRGAAQAPVGATSDPLASLPGPAPVTAVT